MSDRSVIEWLRYQAEILRVWQAEAALEALDMCERCHGLPLSKKPAWVVTWARVRRNQNTGITSVDDVTSTLTSWPAVLDYIERIVPRDATFTVKLA